MNRSLGALGASIALGVGVLLSWGGTSGVAVSPTADAAPKTKVMSESAAPKLAEVSRPFVPSSVGELAKSSQLIVVGTPVDDSRVEVINGVPFTVRDVVVESKVKGPKVTRVTVREFGDGSLSTSLVPGQKSVLFLQPFEFTRGKPTGEWVVTGLVSGIYRVEDGMAHRVDPDAPGLPTRISVGDLVRSASSPR